MRGRFADDLAPFRGLYFEAVGLISLVAHEREPIGLQFDGLIAAMKVNGESLHRGSFDGLSSGREIKPRFRQNARVPISGLNGHVSDFSISRK